jgi:hypothetical protein
MKEKIADQHCLIRNGVYDCREKAYFAFVYGEYNIFLLKESLGIFLYIYFIGCWMMELFR